MSHKTYSCRLSTAGDADEISYIDFGMPSEKDPRSRNTSERSMDSGYFETCWNNPLRTYDHF